jgi:hypothetical protein
MSTDHGTAPVAQAQGVDFSKDSLIVYLADGRSIHIPLERYPRLLYATAAERRNWRLVGDGEGIYWSELDEDVSVENLIQGKSSGEGFRSLMQWLQNRAKRR